MLILRSLDFKALPEGAFPFNLPVLRKFQAIEFQTPVSIFIGENGSGKSTVLESLAFAIGLATISNKNIEHDGSLKAAQALAPYVKLAWGAKSKRGLFFRAEDFLGFVRSIQDVRAAFDKDMQDWEASLEGGALSRVRGMVTNQKNALTEKYGQDLNAYSHGEGFMKIFQSRFSGKGVYVLDEPEASLSPLRQLSFMALVQEMVKVEQAQFILATHSPIIMGMPGATLYELQGDKIVIVKYEETEHYQITKGFLENREAYLRHLTP
jgi:predicted ATPase